MGRLDLNQYYHDDHHLNNHHVDRHDDDDHLHGFTQERAVGQLLVVKYCQAC